MSVSYNCYVVVGVPVKEVLKPVKVPRFDQKTGKPVVEISMENFLKLGDTEITDCDNSMEFADGLGLDFISYYDSGDGIIGIIIEKITDEEGLVELTSNKVVDMLSTCQEILDDEILDNKEVARVYLMKVAG